MNETSCPFDGHKVMGVTNSLIIPPFSLITFNTVASKIEAASFLPHVSHAPGVPPSRLRPIKTRRAPLRFLPTVAVPGTGTGFASPNVP